MSQVTAIHRSAACGGASGILALLVACGALAASSDVLGQARGLSVGELKAEGRIDPPVTHEQEVLELDTWLRRMVGRFRRVEVNNLAVSDGPLMDCVGIGEGAGVNCMSGAGKVDRQHSDPPTMGLFGIDPDAPGIRYLRVNEISVAETNIGVLRDDAARFFGTCATPPSRPATFEGPPPQPIACELELRIELPAPDKDMVMVERRTVTLVVRGRTRKVVNSARLLYRRVPE